MEPRTRSVVLFVGVVLLFVALVPRLSAARLPGNNIGYAPVQPIAFSHRLHAGELEMDCLYCHSGAERSRHAGIPTAEQCMNCHKFVTAPFNEVLEEDKAAEREKRKPRPIMSPEILKVYEALALDEKGKPDPAKTPQPIEWTQVHKVPAFVYFDHRSHITAGVTCQRCHGPVEVMERVRQEFDLSMGWCVNCHRDANTNGIDGRPVAASLDCAACHY
jgi:hypothetical protein